jgi:hypothetical protein
MTRIPAHTIDSAPPAARALLTGVCRHTAPLGKPLDLHGHMAHAPAVLAAYVGFRRAIAEHGTFAPLVRSAVMLAASSAARNAYARSINTWLAHRAGWSCSQVLEISDGALRGDVKLSALLRVAWDAASHDGLVSEARWTAAIQAGWSDVELAELFVYVGVIGYVSGFANYAGVSS